METTIKKLVKGLQQLLSVDAVRRETDAFALDDAGRVTAITISKEHNNVKDLSGLILDEEAAALQYLCISGIETLSEIVFRKALPELTHADLSRCALTGITLPPGFSKLEQLYLHHNQLQEITFEAACPGLMLLDLANNQLAGFSLPHGFKKLAYLYLPDNKLESLQLPADARELNILHLRNNLLKDLPGNLLDFANLEALYLFGNPLPSIPKEVIESDERKSSWEGVRNYLLVLQQGSIINTEAKIVLIGNGMVGKTTLSHQLRKNKFISDYNRTHGILIKDWDIDGSEFPPSLKNKINSNINREKEKNPQAASHLKMPEKLTIKLWDFGGQEYYHATHRLFLNSNILYMLLWDEETDRLDEQTGIFPNIHWQQNINYYAPENITFLIQNRVKGKYGVNAAHLIYKINFRDEMDPVSIEQYELDIQTLKKGILSQLPNMSFLGEPFPKVYDDIRKALKEETKPVMRFDEFERLCIRNDQTPGRIMSASGQIETLTKFLHDTGSIICYKYQQEPIIDRSLKEFVFVNPVWVTHVIYDVLKSDLTHRNGEFDDDYLKTALSVSDLLKMDEGHLSNADWVSLMKSFELIFEVKKAGKTKYIAPQFLPLECQDQEKFNFAVADRNLKDTFTINFPAYIPNSLFIRFVTRFGSQSAPDFIYWKQGLVFYSPERKAAFVQYSKEAENHMIHVQVQDGDAVLAHKIFDFFNSQSDGQFLISVNRLDFIPVEVLVKSYQYKGCNYKDKDYLCEDFNFIFKAEPETTRSKMQEIPVSLDEKAQITEIKPVKTIKVFLASSSELKLDRDELRIWISAMNDLKIKKGVYFEFIQWEYFPDAISDRGLQNEYNQAVENSDIMLCLFFTKVGKYTLQEFETANQRFKKTGKPLIYTYFFDGQVNMQSISAEDFNSLNAFKEYLKKEKHYQTICRNVDDLKVQFRMQLDLLEEKGKI